MTAQQICDAACGLMMGSREPYATAERFLPILNLLLAENTALENGLRTFAGQPTLSAAPTIGTLAQEVPYQEIFTRVILPYGAAGLLYTEEDAGAAIGYRNKYEYERSLLPRGQEQPIVDVYGGIR